MLNRVSKLKILLSVGGVLLLAAFMFAGGSLLAAEVASVNPIIGMSLVANADGTIESVPIYYDDYPAAGDIPVDYVVGAAWDHNPVTYSFLNCPRALDCGAAHQAVREGLEAWDAVSGITMNEVSSGGDIQVGWFGREHGDGNSFDGPGNILAHAFFPLAWLGEIAGDLHFDDEENWVVGNPTNGGQIHLGTVAMHEGGHSLGLDHSDVPGSLMWPEYVGVRGLQPDDIAGIQAIYGPPNADDTGEAPPPAPDDPGVPPAPSNVTAFTTTAVRMRSGPGTGYANITTLPTGTTVPILGKNASSQWIYIEHNGTRGWLAAWLCQINGDLNTVPVVNDDGSGALPPGNPPAGDPPADPPTDDPGVPAPPPGSVTGYGDVALRIRNGPGTGYTQIGTLPANVSVPILGRSESNLWVFIQHGETRGWVASWLTNITGDLNTVPIVDNDGNPVPLSMTQSGDSSWASDLFEWSLMLMATSSEVAYE